MTVTTMVWKIEKENRKKARILFFSPCSPKFQLFLFVEGLRMVYYFFVFGYGFYYRVLGWWNCFAPYSDRAGIHFAKFRGGSGVTRSLLFLRWNSGARVGITNMTNLFFAGTNSKYIFLKRKPKRLREEIYYRSRGNSYYMLHLQRANP